MTKGKVTVTISGRTIGGSRDGGTIINSTVLECISAQSQLTSNLACGKWESESSGSQILNVI